MKRYTEEQVRELARDFAGDSTMKDTAAVMKISTQYLCDFLHGRREPGPAILKALGLTKEVRYVLSSERRIYGLIAQWQRERAETQMTLGKLIASLEAMPNGAEVANLNSAHSYRGYYSDLAFEHDEGTRQATELLAECKEAMGQVFEGYKGGNYAMSALTPIWLASYGRCGLKLMAIHAGGKVETAEDK